MSTSDSTNNTLDLSFIKSLLSANKDSNINNTSINNHNNNDQNKQLQQPVTVIDSSSDLKQDQFNPVISNTISTHIYNNKEYDRTLENTLPPTNAVNKNHYQELVDSNFNNTKNNNNNNNSNNNKNNSKSKKKKAGRRQRLKKQEKKRFQKSKPDFDQDRNTSIDLDFDQLLALHEKKTTAVKQTNLNESKRAPTSQLNPKENQQYQHVEKMNNIPKIIDMPLPQSISNATDNMNNNESSSNNKSAISAQEEAFVSSLLDSISKNVQPSPLPPVVHNNKQQQSKQHQKNQKRQFQHQQNNNKQQQNKKIKMNNMNAERTSLDHQPHVLNKQTTHYTNMTTNQQRPSENKSIENIAREILGKKPIKPAVDPRIQYYQKQQNAQQNAQQNNTQKHNIQQNTQNIQQVYQQETLNNQLNNSFTPNQFKKDNVDSTSKHKDIICRFFARGKCHQGERCEFKHDGEQQFTVCKHYKSGSCGRGDECPYVHDLKSEPCRFYHVAGKCDSQDNCPFSHDPLTPFTRRQLHAMTGPCRFYHFKGYCKDGEQCLFSHTTISEKKRNELESSLKPCRFFHFGKTCTAGQDCFYLHEEASPQSVQQLKEELSIHQE